MEAYEITEQSPTTMDEKKHSSSKNPSAEDLQEPSTSKPLLKLDTPPTPSEAYSSEALLVTPTSLTLETQDLPKTTDLETLLEPHISETIILLPLQISSKPHTSEHPSKSSGSLTSLENFITDIPLDVRTSKTQNLKGLELSLLSNISVSSPETLSDLVLDHSFSGPSTQVEDTSAKLTEEAAIEETSAQLKEEAAIEETSAKLKEEAAKEDKQHVAISNITTHTVQTRLPGVKKKGKKGVSRYTVRPVVPSKQAKLVGVNKAMHRELFDNQVNLFHWKKSAVLKAIQSGIYIGWRCPHYLWHCFRIGDDSKCFCGHLLKQHRIVSDISVPCGVSQCRCLIFCFIPSRPEEVGQFWLMRRAAFDPKAWRAQCRCKHSHEEHAATGAHACRHHGCCCNCFESNFLCSACERRWEEHETFFETEETRRRGGRPNGADFVPFAEMPVPQEAILNRDIHCQQLAQAFLSLVQISNKVEANRL